MLKLKILENLNREVIINRPGGSFEFGGKGTAGNGGVVGGRSMVMKRPSSSVNIFRQKQHNRQSGIPAASPATQPPRNPIKLSNLIEELESNNSSLALKQHLIPKKSRKLPPKNPPPLNPSRVHLSNNLFPDNLRSRSRH